MKKILSCVLFVILTLLLFCSCEEDTVTSAPDLSVLFPPSLNDVYEKTEQSFNANGQLDLIFVYDNQGMIGDYHRYFYDDAGRISVISVGCGLTQTFENVSEKYEYVYNKDGRVDSVLYYTFESDPESKQTAKLKSEERYQYRKDGSIKKILVFVDDELYATEYNHENERRIDYVNGMAYRATYDGNGILVSERTTDENNALVTLVEYDSEGRLRLVKNNADENTINYQLWYFYDLSGFVKEIRYYSDTEHANLSTEYVYKDNCLYVYRTGSSGDVAASTEKKLVMAVSYQILDSTYLGMSLETNLIPSNVYRAPAEPWPDQVTVFFVTDYLDGLTQALYACPYEGENVDLRTFCFDFGRICTDSHMAVDPETLYASAKVENCPVERYDQLCCLLAYRQSSDQTVKELDFLAARDANGIMVERRSVNPNAKKQNILDRYLNLLPLRDVQNYVTFEKCSVKILSDTEGSINSAFFDNDMISLVQKLSGESYEIAVDAFRVSDDNGKREFTFSDEKNGQAITLRASLPGNSGYEYKTVIEPDGLFVCEPFMEKGVDYESVGGEIICRRKNEGHEILFRSSWAQNLNKAKNDALSIISLLSNELA